MAKKIKSRKRSRAAMKAWRTRRRKYGKSGTKSTKATRRNPKGKWSPKAKRRNKKLKAKFGTILVGGGAIALSWSANTVELIALASRAFAFYYLLQCLVAISVSKSAAQKIAFGLIALALAFITVFAVPAS